jgi:hypothetical protein
MIRSLSGQNEAQTLQSCVFFQFVELLRDLWITRQNLWIKAPNLWINRGILRIFSTFFQFQAPFLWKNPLISVEKAVHPVENLAKKRVPNLST